MDSAIGLQLLTRVDAGVAAIPWAYLAVGHSLTAAAAFRGAHGSAWAFNWLVAFFGGFGGGVVTALIIMMPSVVPFVLFANNQLFFIFSLSWWAINYSPRGIVAAVYGLLPVRAVALACRAVFRAGLIMQRVDVGVKLFPGVTAAPLVLGTLAGSGGALLVDAVTILAGYSKGPSQLARPTFPLRSAAITSLAYYLAVHVLGMLSQSEGRGLITSLFVAHSLAESLSGRVLDWTAPPARLFHAVTGIPQADTAGAGGRAGRRSAPPRTPSPAPLQHRAAAAAANGFTDGTEGINNEGLETEQVEMAPTVPKSARRSTRRRTAARRD